MTDRVMQSWILAPAHVSSEKRFGLTYETSYQQKLQSKIRRYPSQVKFRFGNNQTLQSEYQIQIPLQCAPQTKRKLWLTIEVLPGKAPFLFSKKAFKQLGGVLDTTDDSCYLQRPEQKITLLYFV